MNSERKQLLRKTKLSKAVKEINSLELQDIVVEKKSDSKDFYPFENKAHHRRD